MVFLDHEFYSKLLKLTSTCFKYSKVWKTLEKRYSDIEVLPSLMRVFLRTRQHEQQEN